MILRTAAEQVIPESNPAQALTSLLVGLKAEGYQFVTPTPATHSRVVSRTNRGRAMSLRDILGWSLPFERTLLAPEIFAALEEAGAIEACGPLLRSSLRVSSLHGDLYAHSAFPTDAEDAVFFGPDSYRFADLIQAELSSRPVRAGAHIVDIGTGAGVGAIVAARSAPDTRITMTDINPKALGLAAINAAAAGVSVRTVLGSDLGDIGDPIDIALANPPYIIDAAGRDYRDGGAMHGGAVGLEMARMAVARLAPGGRLILYSGSAIISGTDPLEQALRLLARRSGCAMRYREIDPDVFGEELDAPAYSDVERIAIIAAVIERPRTSQVAAA